MHNDSTDPTDLWDRQTYAAAVCGRIYTANKAHALCSLQHPHLWWVRHNQGPPRGSRQPKSSSLCIQEGQIPPGLGPPGSTDADFTGRHTRMEYARMHSRFYIESVDLHPQGVDPMHMIHHQSWCITIHTAYVCMAVSVRMPYVWILLRCSHMSPQFIRASIVERYNHKHNAYVCDQYNHTHTILHRNNDQRIHL